MITSKKTARQGLSVARATGYGAIGGIVGGFVMLGIMTGIIASMNLPSNLFPMLLGTMLGQQAQDTTTTGIGLHLVASTLIGSVLGVVTGGIKLLQIKGFGKGIAFGTATGVIAFTVLFLPVTTSVMPATMMNLMKMMNPSMSDQTIMVQLQTLQPMILGGALLSHIVYGVVLGSVLTALVKVTASKEFAAECKACQLHFKSEKEFLEHQAKHRK
jgi:hypothetical protein